MPRKQEQPKFHTAPRRTLTLGWRARIQHTRLVWQASSILLQRHSKFWAPLLRRLKLASKFTPFLFHQILNKIKTHPKVCLNFFNYVQKSLDFKPDLEAQCEVTRILFGSGMPELGMPILNSIIEDYPPTKTVPLLIHSPESPETIATVLNSVVECYCRKHLHLLGLEVYRMAKQCGVRVSLGACNALLYLLCDKNEVRSAWCCFASAIRSGIWGDHSTWCVIAKLLYNDGKFERISKILDMRIYAREVFDLMIDDYSKRGDFEAAFAYINEMFSKGIHPSFGTYSSVLDGACKYQDRVTIESVLSCMMKKGHISDPDYDLIIQKLCGIGKTFAVEFFYKRACGGKIELRHGTYGCMLKALLSEEGRVKDAVQLYNVMQSKKISADEICYDKFVNALCKERPSNEVSRLLVEITRKGFISEPKEVSAYINKLCAECQWRDAEEIMESVLDQGFLLDAITCGSVVKWYCCTGKIERAIKVQNKLEEMEGVVDTKTYEVLLEALLRGRRIEEGMKVFDYMRRCRRLSSESYSMMIRCLCGEKEFRRAMKLHDEMVELGMKPDLKAYKKLISGFG